MKIKNLKKGPARTCFKGGFTLLEILLVVGIISILAGIVIVAINPAKQLAQVRNAERKSDIKQINSALTQYYIDEFEYPGTITPTPTEICDTGATSSPSGVDCDGLIDLSILVPDYITAIPKDPKATGSSTGYSVLVSSGKIGLDATLAELEEDITLGIASGTGGGGDVSDCTGTGGTITRSGNYCIHTFLLADSGDDFVPPDGGVTADVLVVAGGGGGGGNTGGGGGAGGVISETINLTDAVNIVVGDKGIGAQGYMTVQPTNGGDSSLGDYVAFGGGWGGNGWRSEWGGEGAPGLSGNSGGSGGGAHGESGHVGAPGSGNPVQGHDGGYADSSFNGSGGGGGGGGSFSAGQDGSNIDGNQCGGNGGDGITSDISGTAHIYASGGGGGQGYPSGYPYSLTCGLGGNGAGAGGVLDENGETVRDATSATYYGSGGGGTPWISYHPGGEGVNAGDGYPGIVIVRYAI